MFERYARSYLALMLCSTDALFIMQNITDVYPHFFIVTYYTNTVLKADCFYLSINYRQKNKQQSKEPRTKFICERQSNLNL
jgi:hypothetical protein